MSEDVKSTPEGASGTPEPSAKASAIPQEYAWVSDPQQALDAILKLQEKSSTRKDDLDALRAERDRLAAEKQRAEDARLAEEKKWQELAEKRQGEVETLQAQLKDAALDRAVITAAADLKFHNWQEAKKLADLSGVDTSTNDGGASAVKDALEDLAKNSPHLVHQAGDTPQAPQQPQGAGVINPAGKVALTAADLSNMKPQEVLRLMQEDPAAIDEALSNPNS